MKDGLSHHRTNTIFQDSHGFIWVGTQYGLNRFDGHEWISFSKEKDGLANNEVIDIMEDEEGWLWIYRKVDNKIKDISFVHHQSLEVKTFEARFPSLKWTVDDFNNAVNDGNKVIYISTITYGLLTYQNKEWKSVPIKGIKKLLLKKVTSNRDLLGQAYVGKELKIIRIRPNGRWQSLQTIHESETHPLYFEDAQQQIWSEHNSKIYCLRNGQNSFEEVDIHAQFSKHVATNFRTMIFGHGQEMIWFIDENHFFAFSLERQLIYDFKEEFQYILDDYVKNLYFDRQGNVWIMTDNGVYKIRLTPRLFQQYLAVPLHQYNVANAYSIRGMQQNGNNLWVNTTYIHQYLIDLENGSSKLVEGPKVLHPSNKLSYNNYITRPVIKGQQLNAYYAFGTELIYYEEAIPKTIYYWKKREETTMGWSLYQSPQQRIWIGTLEKGLAYLEQDSITFFKKYNGFNKLQKSSVYHFLNWDEQTTLVASTNGLYVLDEEAGIIQAFSLNATAETKKIPSDVIHHIHRDKKNPNILWLATGGYGVLQLTVDENWNILSKHQITLIDGLSNNVTHAIYEDDYENLWISSDDGLTRYHKPSKQAKVYTTQDGLPHNEFNRTSHHQAADGTLFFGTINGVAAFHPSDLLQINAQTNVPLSITNFQQFDGKSGQLQDRTSNLLKNKKIILKPKDKFFILKFALLEYDESDLIKYSYQISGTGNKWLYLNDNQLRISGLSYGKQTLKIQAQSASGQTIDSVLEISIQVLRPFHLRWWFILSMIAIIVSTISYYFRSRTQALKNRQIELEKLVDERTQKIKEDKAIIEQQATELRALDNMKSKFFANVSHELRTPLTLMLAPIANTLRENQLTNKAYTNLLLAQKNGQRLHRMINEILDLTKLEAGKLEVHTKKTAWYNFLKNIVASFESVANQKEIDFFFEYQENKYLQVLLDQKKVEIILLNLLSNAFKFTPKHGKVEMLVKDGGAYLDITIANTGHGIPANDLPYIFNRFYQSKDKKKSAEGGTGIGLALTKELVQLLGGRINVKSKLGTRTTFTLQLPKKEVISKIDDEEAVLIQNEVLLANQRLEHYKQKTLNDQQSKSATTILLVEDNNDLRFFIRSMLATEFNVVTANNGLEGLKKLPTVNPQLIISDIMMPIMDGYEFVEKVKTNEQFNHLPIIVLTARADFDDKMKALRIGVDDYLTKPFIEEELFIRVHNLLHNANNRQLAIEEITAEEEVITRKDKAVLTKSKPKVTTAESQAWLAEVEQQLLKNIESPSYTIDQLASDMSIGKRQLTRRIKSMVGVSTGEYLKTIRYTKARELLETQAYSTVKAVAYSVGFKDVVNFSRQFRERFGKFPSEYY